MPQATFTLTMPEAIWIGKLSRSYPDARFRVVAAVPGDTLGTGLVEIRHADLDSIIEEFQSFDSVTETEVMSQSQDRVCIQFETDVPLLLFAMQETGIPLQTPFEIIDGSATWEITASQERLAALVEQFEAFGIPFEVDRLQQEIDSERLMTKKQSMLVEEALERGYYDTPRECTLVELAEDLDMAPSTVSETLHRAEERLIKEIMESEDVINR